MYDVVCSVVIGGIVLVMLVGFNSNIVQSASVQTIKVMAQSDLTTATSVLENDLKMMGFHVYSRADSAIQYADSNKIVFVGDFQDSGTMDTITYSFNPTAPSGHANTNTRILTRTYAPQGTNPSSISINLGITRFRLWYYNSGDTALASNPIPAPKLIKSFRIAMNVESTVPYKETTMPYLKLNPGAYWERIIKPKNLR
jgi:lipopolysaccharide export LptBFGC system permease protein LptF